MNSSLPFRWDHATVLDAMTDALPRQPGTTDGSRPLAALSTRDSADPAIALLDCWATIGDSFSLYQRYHADESYLGSARESLSVVELARLLGYTPAPGVCAETWLAFTMDEPLRTGHAQWVPARTRVRSIPPAGGTSVVFETTADLPTRPEYNDLRPVTTRAPRLAVWETGVDQVLVRVMFEPGPGNEGEIVEVEALLPVDFELPAAVGPHVVVQPVDTLWLDGITTRLTRGERLLVVGRHGDQVATVLRTIVEVEVEAPHQRTRVQLDPISYTQTTVLESTLGDAINDALPTDTLELAPGAPLPATDAAGLAALISGARVSEASLNHATKSSGLSVGKLNEALAMLAALEPTGAGGIFRFEQRVGAFGHAAPAYATLNIDGLADDWDQQPPTIWADSSGLPLGWAEGMGATIRLERAVPQVEPGSWVVVEGRPYSSLEVSLQTSPDWPPQGQQSDSDVLLESDKAKSSDPSHAVDVGNSIEVTSVSVATFSSVGPRPFTAYRVKGVRERSVADYAQSGRVTELRLEQADGSWIPSAQLGSPTSEHGYQFRTATIRVASRRLRAVAFPAVAPVGGTEGVWGSEPGRVIMLDRLVAGLEPGRAIVVRGRPAAEDGTAVGPMKSEVAHLAHVDHINGRTTLFLERRLEGRYARDSVQISANVAPASHGQTHRYPLSLIEEEGGSRGALQLGPLTYRADASESRGSRPALDVWVDDVPWTRVDTLHGRSEADTVFELRHHGDGRVTLGFGDGQVGTRPSGRVGAAVVQHRVGVGLAGNVAQQTLVVLQDRSLGIREVTNPLPARGGLEPASLAGIRHDAPRSVRVLDRVVSARDVQDFAAGFAGIGKAQAQGLWLRGAWVVHLSVCDDDGAPIEPIILGRLRDTLRAHAEPGLRLRLGAVERIDVRLRLAVAIEAGAHRVDVEAAVEQHLRATFGAEARALARPITASAILDEVHDVPGLRAAAIVALHRATSEPAAASMVSAHPVRLKGAEVLDAELVVLDDGVDGLLLEELKA
ncbi:MAG: hypothetical protein K0V04_21450 [Deltaproteobacteria bacterium]|nr:hypothetical protein [Deltaproteobacteria bacterium]